MCHNGNLLSKSNVILNEVKNLVCISLCFRDPSLRSILNEVKNLVCISLCFRDPSLRSG